MDISSLYLDERVSYIFKEKILSNIGGRVTRPLDIFYSNHVLFPFLLDVFIYWDVCSDTILIIDVIKYD